MTSTKIDGIECDKLTLEDREMLIASFSMEEIKNAVFGIKHNKAAGPDGLPIEFYQEFWEDIKHDLKELFDAFNAGKLDIARLNHGVISLILKFLMLLSFRNSDLFVCLM